MQATTAISQFSSTAKATVFVLPFTAVGINDIPLEKCFPRRDATTILKAVSEVMARLPLTISLMRGTA